MAERAESGHIARVQHDGVPGQTVLDTGRPRYRRYPPSEVPGWAKGGRDVQSNRMTWAGRVVTVLAMLPFVPSAVMKLLRRPEVIEGMSHLGLPESLIVPLGVLELLCVAVYAVPRTAALGAILLTGYIGGAILTHLRIGEPVYSQIVIGILVWLGLWLREPRLRRLLPLSQPTV